MALYDPTPATLSPALRVMTAARANPHEYAARLDIKPEQVLNLVRLAEYLRALPQDYARFRMNTFMTAPGDHVCYASELPECGTSACAVGHGPDAGIAPLSSKEGWGAYSDRCFGTLSGMNEDAIDILWNSLFEGAWDDIDDTPHGAAARILWFLDQRRISLLETDVSSLDLYSPYLE